MAEPPLEALPPEMLHLCRGECAPYDWRATATVGRFVCRGCRVVGECGACAELVGQRLPPRVVPLLCATHGGLLQIGITALAIAVDVPARTARGRMGRRAHAAQRWVTQDALLGEVSA